jgi:Tfp pilus assembly protein PilO
MQTSTLNSQLNSYKENIIFAIICLGGLLILGLFGLKPLYEQSGQLDAKNLNLRGETIQQQHLSSIMAIIDGKLLANKHEVLPNFKAAALPVTKAGNILSDLKMIAKTAHLQIVNITPELADKKNDWHKLPVKTRLRGNFPNLRKFILDLLTLSYVKGVDRIKIESSDNKVLCEITFTVQLS